MSDLRRAIESETDVIVIAEAGVNHNGDEAIAHKLIDAAVHSGAQFVKFQTFNPELLVAPKADATRYQKERGASSQSDLLSALALPASAWERLRDHAADAGIGFLSTPFDLPSARVLIDLGVDGLKLSSGELTNLGFLRDIAAFGVPMLVSTGMGTADEVLQAADACAAAPFLAFFHCVSAYPAPEDECNLLAIPALRAATGVPVGWSDHTTGVDSAIVAASVGARLFEKHLTLDVTMEGPDHAASLDPDQMRDYVRRVRAVPALLGDGVKRRMPSEEENAPLVRRSWHTTRDLAAGTVLHAEDLIALRPEGGVSPTIDIVGRVLTRDLPASVAIEEGALSESAG